ncbi:MAG: LptF/LptG family permease [Bacteroidota bacterium]
MKILDRYILKKFFLTFIFLISILVVVITLIDYLEKSGYYIRYNVSHREIITYYYAFVPFVLNFLTPITVFITTVFVTSRLSQHTEIIAMLSSGISFARILRPYLGGAMAIALCSFYLTGWQIAKTNALRVDFETKYIDHSLRNTSKHLHIRIDPETYLYVQRYYTYDNAGTNVTLETIRDHRLIRKISSQRIYWLPDQGIWQLQDWVSRELDGLTEKIAHGAILDQTFDLHPNDFAINPKLHEALTLPELSTHIKSLKEKGADNVHLFVIEKYVRYMSPFAAIILTVLGMLVSAHKARGGTGLQIILGFILALTYIALFLFAKGVAEAKGSYLLLTIWTPNVIFSLLGIALYRLIPK